MPFKRKDESGISEQQQYVDDVEITTQEYDARLIALLDPTNYKVISNTLVELSGTMRTVYKLEQDFSITTKEIPEEEGIPSGFSETLPELPDADYREAWEWSGEDVVLNEALRVDLKVQKITTAIQSKLDGEAISRKYDSINSIAKYMGFENMFRAECEALGAWAANVWTTAFTIFGAWQAGGPEPTEAEVLEALPDFVL